MNYFIVTNLSAGEKKGHYALPVSMDVFYEYMEQLLSDGFTINPFDVTDPVDSTYYCVYESVSDIPDRFCFQDANVVSFITSADKED